MSDLPPLPEGFQPDAAPQGGIPALPSGFQLDHPTEQPPGFLEQFGHQLGLTGRYALEGAGNVVGVLSDPIQALMYEAAPKRQTMSGLIKGEAPQSSLPYMPLGEQASWLADKIGLPKPATPLEKTVAGASKGLVSTGLTAGLGGAVGAAELAAQPVMQAVSAMLGGGTEAATDNPLLGAAASLLPGAKALGSMTARGVARGADPSAMQDTIKAFEAAGTTPSVGQATQSGPAQLLESFLAKMPGSAGVMARKARTQGNEIGAQMGRYADEMAPGSDPTQAGAAIEKGITGEGGFLDRFKQQSSALYDAVDQHLPNGADGTQVGVPATVSMLYKLTKPIKGAENVSGILADPKIASIADALNQDVRGSVVAGGQAVLPYQAIKELRTQVGNKIADAGLAPDVSTRQLKQLYGALSEDMRNGLKNVSEDAYTANNQAENFVRNGHAQIDQVESVVGRAGGPEKIFNAAMSGTRDGATTLNNVMSALKPEEQNVVSSAVVRRMGMAAPGQQSDTSDVFSTQSFLTNWNKLSPQAKTVLFKNDSELRNNLDKIASVTNNLREGSKVFQNSSGTAPTSALIGLGGAIGSAVLHPVAAVPIIAGLAATNGAARLMTNPTFVKWLARNTTAPIGVLPAQLAYLDQLGQQKKDPDLSDAAQQLSATLGVPTQ